MTYVHVNDHAQEFRVTGDLYEQKAEQEFSEGDLVQASEKAWGAVAQYLKALAAERGWAHEGHDHLVQVANKLANETGNGRILELWGSANTLHSNFYQAALDEKGVRYLMDRSWECLEILKGVPVPQEAPRKSHVRSRPFFRTRGGVR